MIYQPLKSLPATIEPTSTPSEPLRQILEERYQGRNLRTFRRGETIPLGERDIWVVYRGVVQISTLYPSGDEALLGLAVPLMPFGLPLTMIEPYSAIALTHTDLMRLTLEEIEATPALMQCVLSQLRRRLQQTETMLALSSCRRVEERLRLFLKLLQYELGQPCKAGMRIPVRLTHQHLANALGTTRVTVTRLLGQLRREDVLSFDIDHYLVIHPEKLA